MKIYIAQFSSKPMDITANFEKALAAMDSCIEKGCDVIVYPAGCLLGAQLGILKDTDWVACTYNSKIDELCKKAAEHDIAVVTDTVDKTDGSFRPVIENDFAETFSASVVQSSKQLFGNANEICSNTDLVFINWMESGVAGQKYLWTEALKDISAKYGTVFVLNTAGDGYTTHPDFYMTMRGIVKDGKADVYYGFDHLDYCPEFFEVEKNTPTNTTADITDYSKMVSFPVCYSQNPLIPGNVPEKFYCLDLFSMQCESLANRLHNINCKNIVLNLSGGLDSTMALLVCVNTFKMLGLDKKGMHIYTMPGFGTSSTTKGLANDLCDGFGLELKTIDITETCRAALLSIGHDGATPDVTFENVQARTRTMNALNLANHLNALMIGTGDLSEIALGFSTLGGDQIASYNVNSCVSKTVMRTMLGYLVELEMFSCVKEAVNNVLTIPVSPELVPHGGEILQKTEDILAPYKLIDFFIYCTVITKIQPAEVVSRAYDTFNGEFSREYICEKLKMFYRKFAVGQFKRSCAPECADITHVSLIGSNRSFASDGSTDIFLQNL